MTRKNTSLPPRALLVTILMAILPTTTALAFEPAGLLRDFPRTQLLLVTTERCILIDTRVAASNAHRAQGLMHIRSMADYQGMIFFYERPQIITMWMKNTYIPLDMLFASDDGRIVHLHENAVPHDQSIISSQQPAAIVVELNAGRIRAFDIRAGDRIIVPAG